MKSPSSTDWLCYLDRAVFEKTSLQSGAFGRQRDLLISGSLPNLLNLPQIPAENWTHALYTCRHTHRQTQKHTHTHPNMKIQQQQKKIPTINQQVQVFFHRVYSPYLSLFSVYKTDLQVLFTNQPFFTALFTGYTHIHTSASARSMPKARLRHFSETPFCYRKNPEIRTRVCLHTVFFAGCLVGHQAAIGAARCDINTPVSLRCSPNPKEIKKTPDHTRPHLLPASLGPPPRCCMSVSQCNLRFPC